jgi:predicted transcriptional regulator
MWSHTRNINVISKGNTIRYEIPMYMENEIDAKLVSVYKSTLANAVVVEFCIDNVEQNAPSAESQMSELSAGEMQMLR